MDELQMRVEQVIALVKLLRDVIGIIVDFLPDGAFDLEDSNKKPFFSFLSK